MFVLHQTRPTANFVAPLAVGHLTIPPDGELAINVGQAAVFLCTERRASGLQRLHQMVPANDWFCAFSCFCTIERSVVTSGR
jgi:hypothetical protein